MLRTEAQALLNELRAALLATAHYRRALAPHLSARGEALRAQATEREQWSERLAALIRASCDLPDAPDPEREAARELALRMREVLLGDQSALAALAREDERLLALVRRTRATALPAEAQALLDEMAQAL
ncbi:MAG: hypothetical protein WDA11_06650 [Thiohalomonadaceae bacterium]